MKNKTSEIERLIEKYKERIKVINSQPAYRITILEETEEQTLETVIEDLEAII